MYKITYIHKDDTTEYPLFIPGDEDYCLITGSLSIGCGKTGTLSLEIPVINPAKSEVVCLTDEIIVYRDDKEIWRGRATTAQIDFDLSGILSCEGILAYLYDTYYEPFEFQGSPKELLQSILDSHNSKVEARKQFELGEVTVEDPNDYINRSSIYYDRSLNVMTEKLINDSLGGYFRVRVEGDKRYLDYLEAYNTQSSQPVEYGYNILDIAQDIEYSDIASVILPLGAKLEDEDGMETDERLTIESVNGGDIYYQDPAAVAKYGWIVVEAEWDDVTLPENLLTKAQNYLMQATSPVSRFTIKAIDMSWVEEVDPINLGDFVLIKSDAHGLNQYVELTEMRINLLDPAATTLTFGTDAATLTGTTTNSSRSIQESMGALTMRVTNLSTNVLNAVYANIETLVAQSITTDLIVAAVADLGYVTADYLEANYANIDMLEAIRASIEYIQAYYVTTEYLEAQYASLEYVESTFIDTDILEARVALVEEMFGQYVTTEYLTANYATIENLEGLYASIQYIEAYYVSTEYLEAEYASLEYVKSTFIDTDTLEARLGLVESMFSDYVTTEYLLANYATIATLDTMYATIGELDAALANIEAANISIANITSLLAGEAGVGELESIHITTANAIIEDAVIVNALMDTVLASVLTARVIYTDFIKIANNEGQNLWIDGGTIQITDENGAVRVQIGLDNSGNYSYYLWNEEGVLIWDPLGLTEEGLTGNGAIIRDSAVADDANISGYKLNIDEITSILNENGDLVLNATQVTIDGSTLDYKMTQITQSVDDLSTESLVSVVNYYAIGGPDEPPCNPWEEIAPAILGQMILGESVLGFTGWSTEFLKTNEGEYLWFVQHLIYADGHDDWTEPSLFTDEYLRSVVSVSQTELEVIQGQIQAKIWQSDIETATSVLGEQITTITDQYSILTVTIEAIDERVGIFTSTFSDNLESIASQVSEITITLDNIGLSVSSMESVVATIQATAVTDSVTEYYKSTSNTTLTGGEWSTSAPDWEDGTYIWVRTTVYYGVGGEANPVTTDPICLTGNSGTSGIGVVSVTAYYAVTESDSFYPSREDDGTLAILGSMILGQAILGNSGSWVTSMPDVGDNEYLWVCFLVEYTNGVSTWTEPFCMTDASVRRQISIISEQYSNIEIGIDEINAIVYDLQSVVSDEYTSLSEQIREITINMDGINLEVSELEITCVTDTFTEFYQSDSETELTGGSWSMVPPTWEEGKYIWIRTTVTKGDGYYYVGDAVCITGNTGTNGLDGLGISDVIAYYAVTESATYYPSFDDDGTLAILGSMILGTAILGNSGQWSTTMPSVGSNEFLWVATKVIYTNGAYTWTSPFCVTDESLRENMNTIIQQDADLMIAMDSITAYVYDLEVKWADDFYSMSLQYADIVIELSSITSSVYSLNQDLGSVQEQYSQIEQTLGSINLTLSDMESDYSDLSEKYAEISLTLEGINFEVSNLEYICVTDSYTEFYQSTSATEPVGGSWSTTTPTWVDGKYIWIRTTITKGDGYYYTSDPVCITGNTGAAGTNGTNGLGISDVVAYYAVTESSTYYPSFEDDGTLAILGSMILGTAILGNSGQWSTTMPDVGSNEYLWVTTKVTYTDGSYTWTSPFCVTDASLRQSMNTLIQQDADIAVALDSITAYVYDIEAKWTDDFYSLSLQYSEIAIELDSITSTIYSLNEDLGGLREQYAEITLTLEGFSASVSDLQESYGNLSDRYVAIEATLDSISFEVSDLEYNCITDSYSEFYQSTSATEPTGGKWSTEAPVWEDEKYIWIRTTVTRGDGYYYTSNPVCITGNTGAAGTSGADGIGISDVVAYYAVTESATYYPSFEDDGTLAILGSMILGTAILGNSGQWSTTMPTVGNNEFLWVTNKVIYTNGTYTWTSPFCVTDESLRENMNTLSQRNADIQIELDSITAYVYDIEAKWTDDFYELSVQYADIVVGLNDITSTVYDLNVDVSSMREQYTQIEQTINSISLTVSDVQKEVGSLSDQYSGIDITLDGINARVSDVEEKAALALIDGTPYYAVSESPDYYPSHEDDGTLAILGSMVLGQAILGNSGQWTTEQPEAKEGEYIWVSWLIEDADGETRWTDPTLLTDSAVWQAMQKESTRFAEIEVELDSITETVYSWQSTISGISERFAQIELTLDEISLTLYDYEKTVDGVTESVSKIEQDLSSISLNVSNLQTNYNGTVEQVATIQATVEGLSSEILTQVSQTYVTNSTLTSNYTTTSGMNSAISSAQSAAESAASGYTDEQLKGYTNTSDMNNAISDAQSAAEAAANSYTDNQLTSYTNTAGMQSYVDAALASVKIEVTNGQLGSTAYIKLTAGSSETTQSIDLKNVRSAFANDSSAITIGAGSVSFASNTFAVDSTYFSVTEDGVITAKSGKIGSWIITNTSIMSSSDFSIGEEIAGLALTNYSGRPWIIAQKSDGTATFQIDRNGNAIFAGELSAATGSFSGELKAASGTFAGELSAATGTFSGQITANSGSIAGWDIKSYGLCLNDYTMPTVRYDDDGEIITGAFLGTNGFLTASNIYGSYSRFSYDSLIISSERYSEPSISVINYDGFITYSDSGYAFHMNKYTVRGYEKGAYVRSQSDIKYDYWFEVSNQSKYVYANGSYLSGSDLKLKTNVKAMGVENEEEDDYDKFFDLLQPKSFKLTDSDEIHMGFVYQDVVEELDEAGLDSSDSALVQEIEINEETHETVGAIAYQEIIALLVHEVQKLKEQVKQLSAQ